MVFYITFLAALRKFHVVLVTNKLHQFPTSSFSVSALTDTQTQT